MSRRSAAAALIVASAALGFTGAAHAYVGHEMAGQAAIKLAAARKTALAACPGAITAQELEREPGGSGLRYSFDIRRGTIAHEVGVDAATGAVLENKVEDPNPD